MHVSTLLVRLHDHMGVCFHMSLGIGHARLCDQEQRNFEWPPAKIVQRFGLTRVARVWQLEPSPAPLSAMDSSWSMVTMPVSAAFASSAAMGQPLLYFAPFVVYRHVPADVARARQEAEARDTESHERRVMISPNSDGRAYRRHEFIEQFGHAIGLREWEKAVPVHVPPPHLQMGRCPLPRPDVLSLAADKDASETFKHIKSALIRLLDQAEVDEAPWRRRRVRNAKLPRSALAWNRLARKLLLLLRNGRAERLSPGEMFAIGT
jgi:hypothetical protein